MTPRLKMFAVLGLVAYLVACAHEQAPYRNHDLGTKISHPNCSAIGVVSKEHPSEDFVCFYPMTGAQSAQFQTEAQRQRAIEQQFFSTECSRVDVVSDAPAKPSVYESAKQTRLQRVGVECVE